MITTEKAKYKLEQAKERLAQAFITLERSVEQSIGSLTGTERENAQKEIAALRAQIKAIQADNQDTKAQFSQLHLVSEEVADELGTSIEGLKVILANRDKERKNHANG